LQNARTLPLIQYIVPFPVTNLCFSVWITYEPLYILHGTVYDVHMYGIDKQTIFFLGGGSVLAFVLLSLVFLGTRYGEDNELSRESKDYSSSSYVSLSEKEYTGGLHEKVPLFSAIKESDDNNTQYDVFETIKNNVVTLLPHINQDEVPEKEHSSIPATTDSSPDKTPERSPEEIEELVFDRLWPPTYRDSLYNVQLLMKNEGFIDEKDINPNPATDEEISVILRQLVAYAAERGFITEEQKEVYIYHITTTLKDDVTRERQSYEREFKSVSVMLGGQKFLISTENTHDLVRDILDAVAFVLIPQEARASWVTGGSSFGLGGDCYKDDAPFFTVPGFNSVIGCCNCGLNCTGFVCVSVPDCGPHSMGCTIPLGCLNLQCGAWPNAIWDPQTGICGCG